MCVCVGGGVEVGGRSLVISSISDMYLHFKIIVWITLNFDNLGWNMNAHICRMHLNVS